MNPFVLPNCPQRLPSITALQFNRFSILLLLLLGFSLQTRAANRSARVLDSLHQIADSDRSDTNLVYACMELCGHYSQRNPEKSEKYGRKALKFAAPRQVGWAYWNLGAMYMGYSKFDSTVHYMQMVQQVADPETDFKVLGASYNYLARAYQWKGDEEGFYRTTQKAYALSQANTDSVNMAQTLIALGDYHLQIGNLDSCMFLYSKSEEILQAFPPNSVLALCHKNIARVYAKMGEFEEGTKHYFAALVIQDSLNSPIEAALTELNIGQLYAERNNYEKALFYYAAAGKRNEKLQNKVVTSHQSLDFARAYLELKDYDKSEYYLQKAYELAHDGSLGPYLVSNTHAIWGSLAIELKQYAKALQHLEKSLDAPKRVLLPDFLANVKVNLARVYAATGEAHKAEPLFREALRTGKSQKATEVILNASRSLSALLTEQGNYKEALSLFQLSSSLADSLNNASFDKVLIEKEAAYVVGQKDRELLLKNQEIALMQQEQSLQNFAFIGLLGGLSLLMIIGLLAFGNYRQKRRAKEAEVEAQLALQLKEMELLQVQLNTHLIERNTPIAISTNTQRLNDFLKVKLSERELEVLGELCKGKPNKEIGEALFISVNTVRTHLLNIYEKLDVKNRTQAVKKATNLMQDQPKTELEDTHSIG